MSQPPDADRARIEAELNHRIDAVLSSHGADPFPGTRRTIEVALGRSLAPVRPLPALWVRAAQLLLAFVVVGALKMSILGVVALQQMSAAERLGNLGVTLLGAVLLSFTLAKHMAPGALRRLPRGAAPVTLTLGLLVGSVLALPDRGADLFIAEGWPCFRAGLLMALPCGLLYGLLVRRGQPLSWGGLVPSLGAMAGLLAATVPTVRQATCSHQEVIGHLLVWHGGVVLVAALVAGLVSITYRRLTIGQA
ncbi:MAG TPA: NrsF family protein [Vicinamibacterales bacterium]|nr:NrsF family protein [Vicinamibacterales bacterium]